MRITIVLDKEQSTYTNLDTVSGKVCLHVARAVAVSSVTAKLEGESRVRLRLTNNVGESTKTRVEIHKVSLSYISSQFISTFRNHFTVVLAN